MEMVIEPQHFEIDRDKLDRVKEERRRVWRYERVDHIPVVIDLYPKLGETVHDALKNTEAWFASAVRRIHFLLAALPDDYIPYVDPPWQASFTVPVMLGAELWWSDDPNVYPAIRDHPLVDVDQIFELQNPDPYRDGFMPEILRRLGIASSCFPAEVAIGGVDMTSPLMDVLNLMDEWLFLVSLKRHPEAIHHACQVVTRAQLAIQEAALRIVGDVNRYAAVSLWPYWQPEGKKVLVDDDVAALLSPTMFDEFDLTYQDCLFERFGGGLIHNCGPNPSAQLYLRERPQSHGLNCSYDYSRNDFGTLREQFGSVAEETLGFRGHVELLFEQPMRPEEMVANYRHAMEALAPEVIAIPICYLPADTATQEDVEYLYWSMREIAVEYANNIRWREA
jgi:hypothetical protein